MILIGCTVHGYKLDWLLHILSNKAISDWLYTYFSQTIFNYFDWLPNSSALLQLANDRLIIANWITQVTCVQLVENFEVETLISY